MLNIETVRNNMIEQQIRPWNVLELQTLRALAEVRREEFVPASHRHLAFADTRIPLPHGEVMLEPKVSARLVEALALTRDHHVLEIGTGTGYVSALLASLAGTVTSVEMHADFCRSARLALEMGGYQNCRLICADAIARSGEWAEVSDGFDAILVSGSAPNLMELFGDLLSAQGSLVGIEGHAPAMQAVVYRQKHGKRRSLFETRAPRLRGIVEEPTFEF